MRPPPWERLRAAGTQPLRVRAPEPIDVDVLELDDNDVPELGATVFDVHRTTDGFEAWAARVQWSEATTYVIGVRALRIRAGDAALARLLGFEPDRPPAEIEWTWIGAEPEIGREPAEVVCACIGTTREQVATAALLGWRSVDAVKRATKAAFGACQSRRCADAIAEIAGLGSDDPRRGITPRPPLVPVPASILAAFFR